MQLNLDCIRGVLLAVEKLQIIESNYTGGFSTRKVSSKALFDELADAFLQEDIVYTVRLLEDGGYIKADIHQSGHTIPSFYIESMTYKGHEYLEQIKNDTVWSKTKRISSSVGCSALETVLDIAKTVISTAITSKFNLS